MTGYRIVTVDSSLPTILDADDRSVLAIDDRIENGRRVRTPVFASVDIADRVLAALTEVRP